MDSENTKEFRVQNYVQSFEKTLNYVAGTIIATMVAGICHIVSNQKLSLTFDTLNTLMGMLRGIHKDLKELFCIITVILSTVPYYFFYCLKDNTWWNACNGSKDNEGLRKMCVLYEIGIMTLLYLLMRDDLSFSGSKLIIALLNIILMILYLILVVIERKKLTRVGYFGLVVLIGILVYLGLAGNSWNNLRATNERQNYSVVALALLFVVNSLINLGFLAKADSSDETGIISNRKKIMIPIITIAIFTVAVMYCFYYSNGDWKAMASVAVYVTVYEVLISFRKFKKEVTKMVWCVICFVWFVFLMPVLIWKNSSLPNELALNWFILVGVGIYMAAIKYWGYIIKFQFSQDESKKSAVRIMSMMIWFRNSILGSMIFVAIVILASEKYFGMLAIIILCSIMSELFAAYYMFDKQTAGNDRIYFLGRSIEFVAIIAPIVVFIVENTFGFSVAYKMGPYTEGPVQFVFWTGLLIVLVTLGYIIYQWDKGGVREVKEEKEETELPDLSKKGIVNRLFINSKKIYRIFRQAWTDPNMKSLFGVVGMSCAYIGLQIIAIIFISKVFKNVGWRFLLTSAIFVLDWFVLSKKLIDYYMMKLKSGRSVMEFSKIFDDEWDECLAALNEFKERDADQFRQGDRIRPILFYMGSSYGNYDNFKEEEYHNIAKAACSLELIHKSSIILDDYIDGDSMRKGKRAFHIQYDDHNTLILLVNAMTAKAQMNFAECRESFKCSNETKIENMKKLAEIVYSLCVGCYKEQSRGSYDAQNEDELRSIISQETVSLIRGSLELGYSSFHDGHGNRDYEMLGKLGEAFGYIFQYLNDMEPFSQKDLYENSKGTINNFDQGKKNVALLKLYNKVASDEKEIVMRGNYEEIFRLYQKYGVERDVLSKVKEEIDGMEETLESLKGGNEKWVEAFKALFNKAIVVKGWQGKIPLL